MSKAASLCLFWTLWCQVGDAFFGGDMKTSLKLQGTRIYNREDSVVWMGAKNGRFTVKRLYEDLEPQGEVNFPSKVV